MTLVIPLTFPLAPAAAWLDWFWVKCINYRTDCHEIWPWCSGRMNQSMLMILRLFIHHHHHIKTSVCFNIKSNIHPKSKHAYLDIRLDYSVLVAELWRYQQSVCLLLQYDKSRRPSVCGAKTATNVHFLKLNSSVSFQKSWPGHSTLSTDVTPAIHITAQVLKMEGTWHHHSNPLNARC